jgi:drug/metabolite transporter (DMT)-like permease
MMPLMNRSSDFLARLACLFAGAVWGVFWIPLRAIGDTGMHSMWITVVWFACPVLCLLPISLMRWRQIKQGGLSLQLTAMVAGVALTFYTFSFIYTEVMRAMLLYYLTPVWSTLLARVVLGEAVTRLRMLAMGFALTGMMIIFGIGVNFPIPRNVGDWMGLASGMVWAVAVVRLRQSEKQPSIDMTIGFFNWSLVAALLVCLIIAPTQAPSFDQFWSVVPWLIPLGILLIIPGAFASLWGPKFLSPGLVGLLFMTEIVFGSISAALLAGEPFGFREITGVILITAACLLEPLMDLAKSRQASRQTNQH